MIAKRSALTLAISCALLTTAAFPLAPTANAASEPVPVVTVDDYIAAFEEAAQHQRYETLLTQQELESILQAAQQSGKALKLAVQEILTYQPEKGLAVYIDTVGLVTPEQSRVIARQVASSAQAHGATIEVIRTGEAFSDSEYLSTPSIRNKTLWWVAGGLAAGAIAGAGGGGDSGSSSSNNSGSSDELSKELRARYDSGDEYVFTGGYDISHAEIAHLRGYTGKDVTIAVVDSGILQSHEQFASGQILSSYDAYYGLEGSSSATDSDGHGTHVAGIIAAQKDRFRGVGYAPDAQLINVKIADINGVFPDITIAETFPNAVLARGYEYAIDHGSMVINNSWGFSEATTGTVSKSDFQSFLPTFEIALREADTANILSVWAVGNDSESFDQPGLLSALPEFFPEFEDTWIAVTSLAGDGSLSSFAQPCGRAADWCIAAPGDDIISGVIDPNSDATDGYVANQGTSMAAPAVSGSLALLFEAFPTMTPQQVRQKLLDTADKTGIYADQVLYGNGALDLDAATQPLGSSALVLSDGNIDLSSSRLSLGSAFGAHNPFTNISAMVADRYNAGYRINLGSLVKTRSASFDFDTAIGNQQLMQSMETLPLQKGLELQVVRDNTYVNNGYGTDNQNISQIALQMISEEQTFTAGITETPETLPGFAAVVSLAYQPVIKAISNPYLQVGEDEDSTAGFSVSQNLSADTALVVGVLGSENRSAAIVALDSQPLPDMHWHAQLGYVVEKNSFLGSEGEGAFANMVPVATTHIGLHADYRIAPDSVLFTSFYSGSTAAGSLDSPLLRQTGNMYSSSYTLGGITSNLFDEGDAIGLMLHQPLAVTSAQVNLTVADGYQGNQFALRDIAVDLAPAERQTDYQLFYDARISGLDNARLSFTHIENLNHRAGNDDNVILFTASKSF